MKKVTFRLFSMYFNTKLTPIKCTVNTTLYVSVTASMILRLA